MRKAALLIPVNSVGEVLLQFRSKSAPTYPSQWGFFGGGVEDSETPEEAVIREAKEELGLRITEIELITHIPDQEANVDRYFFKVVIDLDVESLKSQQKEGDTLGFFSTAEIKRLPIITDAHLESLIGFL